MLIKVRLVLRNAFVIVYVNKKAHLIVPVSTEEIAYTTADHLSGN